MFQLQNEEKNHNKFQALQVCNCSYLCQDLCGDIFMQKPVINLQLHQQQVSGWWCIYENQELDHNLLAQCLQI